MKRFIENPGEQIFDLLVVGGGITGAAVAYEGASRGLDVALIDKGDFGGATSAATSKLIHGGLRYLKNFEFGLVRESLRERRILENIAPNFVYPIPTMVTNHAGKSNGAWMVKAGLILYDGLSFDKGNTWDPSKKIPCHRSVSRDEVLALEPNVRAEGLTGGFIYYDCINICPERLTLAFLKSAVKYGAQVSNYAQVEGFMGAEAGRVCGVVARDLLRGETVEIKANLVVNCAGSWADILFDLAKGDKGDGRVRRSEGVHFITDKLVNRHVVVSVTPGRRHFFLIPWRGCTLIGTTDKEYVGNPDDYTVTRQSLEELLTEVNASFGTGVLRYDDIKRAYGGLRPLVEDQTEETYQSSRKYEIHDNAGDGLDGLVTVEGGKYTTSRGLASQVMAVVQKKIAKPLTGSISSKEFLCGCEIPDMEAFLASARDENSDFGAHTIDYLCRNYGTEHPEVLAIAREDRDLSTPINGDGEILAQALYAVRAELARTLKDVVLRRTGIGTLGDPGEEILRKTAELMARELDWDRDRMDCEINGVRAALTVPL